MGTDGFTWATPPPTLPLTGASCGVQPLDEDGMRGRTRSGCQNITLAITLSDSVPCHDGYIPRMTPGTLGMDSPPPSEPTWRRSQARCRR
jgi:hypothetical protein